MDLREQLRLLGAGKPGKKRSGGRKTGDGSFLVIEERCPLDSLHGSIHLGGIMELDPAHLADAGKDEGLRLFRPHGAVFFDIETTGLSGGAGTLAFLVGAAHLEGEELVLRQFFLEDLAGEPTMLHRIHGHFREFDGLVSYNGKTFDLPILRNRFMIQGVAREFAAGYHLDLLHTARRFWRGDLASCRLKEVERELLGISRVGDVDGWEIPGLYLDYLRTGDRSCLEPVILHNLLDVKSLVALTILAAHHVKGAEERRWEEPPEARPIRASRSIRDPSHPPVIRAGEAGMEGTAGPRFLALQRLSLILKKQGRLPEARKIWQEMARDYPKEPFALGELAALDAGVPGRKRTAPGGGKKPKAAAGPSGARRKSGRAR